jgi:Na+/H+ antiporter NhaD/arsenite permease-like protein
MEIAILLIFVLGYTAITMEHSLKIDKLIPALLMMAICWTIIALGIGDIQSWFDPQSAKLMDISAWSLDQKNHLLEGTLLHHFGKTAEILIFLMGAMAIVEMIDHFEGFASIKNLIKSKKKITLLWIISCLAFFLSSIIDNLTATIVLITILRKIIADPKDRMWFAGFIIIAANAGGAWTPIGDVTTTMLWMAGKVTTVELVKYLVIPSLLNILIPLFIAFFLPVFKGEISTTEDNDKAINKNASLMLVLGLLLVVAVPVFKTITHLPPYLGMMLSLSLFAVIAEIFSNRSISFTSPDSTDNVHTSKGPTMNALAKIEMPSVLFFLGILMTVAAMESMGMIFNFGKEVNQVMDTNVFVTLLGASSAVIDNVPLVAASIGMFSEYTVDHQIWHFLAYAAGTGGSMLIIGSAAGVVAMGMEKISFFWYLKNVSLLALLGYIGGVVAFLIMH